MVKLTLIMAGVVIWDRDIRPGRYDCDFDDTSIIIIGKQTMRKIAASRFKFVEQQAMAAILEKNCSLFYRYHFKRQNTSVQMAF